MTEALTNAVLIAGLIVLSLSAMLITLMIIDTSTRIRRNGRGFS